MSNNPIDLFNLNREAFCNIDNHDYSKWDVQSYLNANTILNHLRDNEPESPYIEKVSEIMVRYMKYCLDHNKYFPWGDFHVDREAFAKQFDDHIENMELGLS